MTTYKAQQCFVSSNMTIICLHKTDRMVWNDDINITDFILQRTGWFGMMTYILQTLFFNGQDGLEWWHKYYKLYSSKDRMVWNDDINITNFILFFKVTLFLVSFSFLSFVFFSIIIVLGRCGPFTLHLKRHWCILYKFSTYQIWIKNILI